jgi:FdhD protein
VQRYGDANGRADRRVSRRDTVAVEEPMEVRLSWVDDSGTRRSESVAVTMRTPGDDFDLVAGFLHGEGLLDAPERLQEITYCSGDESQAYNVLEARLRPGLVVDVERLRRNFYTTSSCGVCGKASLEAVEVRGCRILDDPLRVAGGVVAMLPERLEEDQGVFQRTGGLHAAGLFDPSGSCRSLREDVGRHNAVDKVVGDAFLHRRLPARDRILVVSGRASFEIVQKAVVARIPVVVAVGAPSSLAVDLAERFNQTLVGFARDGAFNVYTVPERVT